MLPLTRMTAALSVLLLIAMSSLPALAQENDLEATASPMRLSYSEGDISFSRQGAKDWMQAQTNTPLAVGDALYVNKEGILELQMGGRAFVRADEDTQFTLVNQTADFVQFKITSGRMSFDLRTLPTGFLIELDTPKAVFTIDRTGYYRIDVNGDVHFITRRGGRAMMIPAGGQSMSIHPSEEIVVQDGAVAQAKTYVAPDLDRWDRWNYERTESLIDAVSERFLPAGVAGASDLDRYGSWRDVPEYGQVWVPETVAPGWVPYSTGRWVWDPDFQWTWIDDAPWGWAPFHYGRWVHLGGYWGWTPGPAVRHAVYSPALVAFFGVSSQVSVGVGIGGSGVGWVALGWGEPLTPWWGRPGFIGRPGWAGWHGPRVVNNVVINRTTAVNLNRINYRNARVDNAVVATGRDHFGRGRVHDARIRVTRARELEQVRGALPIRPDPTRMVTGDHRGIRPPENILSRPVVSITPAPEKATPSRAALEQARIRAMLPRESEVAAEAAPNLIRSDPDAPVNLIRERAQTGRSELRAPRISTPEAAAPPRAAQEIAPSRAAQEQARIRAMLPRESEGIRETAPSLIRERPQPDRAEPRAPRISSPEATAPPRAAQETAPSRAAQDQARIRAMLPRESEGIRETAPSLIRERSQPDRAEPRAPRISAPEAAAPPRAAQETAPSRAAQDQARIRAMLPRESEGASETAPSLIRPAR